MKKNVYKTIFDLIPKTDANSFEDTKIIPKSKKTLLMELVHYFAYMCVSLMSFFIFTKTPYIGPIFFFLGFIGTFICISKMISVFYILINYSKIMKEEDLSKLVDKK